MKAVASSGRSTTIAHTMSFEPMLTDPAARSPRLPNSRRRPSLAGLAACGALLLGGCAAGTAGSARSEAASAGDSPSGTVSVLSADPALRGPTTAALRGNDVWVVNGQLGGLFGGPAPVPPFTVVSVPLAGGALGGQVVTLPNPDNYYPEGIASAPDGTLFVGSLSLGVITRIPAGSTTPDAAPFVAAGVAQRGVVGLAVDEPRNILWFCDSGPKAPVPGGALVGVSLTAGAAGAAGVEVVRHSMPNPGASPAENAASVNTSAPAGGVTTFCNDIIIDPTTRDVLASDSNGGRIFRVPAADVLTPNSARVWLSAPELAAPASGGYGANGLDFAAGALITCISSGDLIAIDPRSSNPASTLRTIRLDQSLCGPDGLEAVPGSPNDIVVIENGYCPHLPGGDRDRVSRVTLQL